MNHADLLAIKKRAEWMEAENRGIEWMPMQAFDEYGQPLTTYVVSNLFTLDATDKATAEFIAASRKDIPDLVAEVKRLRRLMKDLLICTNDGPLGYGADNCSGCSQARTFTCATDLTKAARAAVEEWEKGKI